MIGLEHEADVFAPEFRQFFGPLAFDGFAAHPHRALGRRQHAAQNGQQCCLAAAGRPHQQRQLAAAKRQADALERAHLRGPGAQHLLDIDRFHHHAAHRVNTCAGSIRVTFMIAAIAETTHITTVSRNRPTRKLGRDDDRQRARRGRAHHGPADQRREAEADHRVEHRLPDDDLVDVAARGADGAQRRELVDVVLGAGIERLRDDHGADDDAEQCAGEQRGARAGAEQPERAAPLAEFGRRQHLDVAERGAEICCAPSPTLAPRSIRTRK